MLVRGQRFQHIDGWCQPIVRGTWQQIGGNMFAPLIFTVYLGEEWDKIPPDRDEMLGRSCGTFTWWTGATTLQPGSPPAWQPRPLRLVRRTSAGQQGHSDGRRNARTKGRFNDWDQSHPGAEGLLPWDTFPQFLIEVMSELPAPVPRSARTMLGTFQGQRFTSAFLARPEGDMIMGSTACTWRRHVGRRVKFCQYWAGRGAASSTPGANVTFRAGRTSMNRGGGNTLGDLGPPIVGCQPPLRPAPATKHRRNAAVPVKLPRTPGCSGSLETTVWNLPECTRTAGKFLQSILIEA